MDAPSTPLDARIRRACIIEVIKEVEKYAHLDESLIRRMIEDVFTLQVHEELWKNEYGSVCPNVRNWAIDLRLVKWFGKFMLYTCYPCHLLTRHASRS